MSSAARLSNAGLRLDGRTAVVSGGTQGIGAAVAVRFAQAGASVYIVGRNATLGQKVIDEMRAQPGHESKQRNFEFIQADLSLVSGINDAAQKLIEKTGSSGIDYLVQTQGGPPNGSFALTSEGHESHFAVQCLSRFGLPYLLTKAGTIKQSVVSVCAPGQGGATMQDISDLDLIKAKADGKYGLLKAGSRDANVVDGFTAEFTERFPTLKFFHVFPGYVQTNAVSNQNFPYPIVVLASIFGPLLARTIGNTPTTYAEVPVYLAANEQSVGKGLEYSNQSLKPVKLPKWISEEPATRKALWAQLASHIEA